MVAGVTAGTAFLETVVGSVGHTQGVVEFSEGRDSSVGRDGDTVKFQVEFGVELEPERGVFTVTHQVPPEPVRYSSQITIYMSV